MPLTILGVFGGFIAYGFLFIVTLCRGLRFRFTVDEAG
jgi:hypothetical protein